MPRAAHTPLSNPAPSHFNRTGLALFLVVFVCVAAYVNSFWNDFVWDDLLLIVENDRIKKWAYFSEIIGNDFFHNSDSSMLEIKRGYFRPLVSLSFMVDYTIWGLHPAGYHLTNIAFHTVNCWLIFLIVRALLPLHSRIPIFAALLFAAHPVHTESVTWISGRTDVLAATFLFLAIYGYVRSYPPGHTAAAARSRVGLSMSVSAFALAIAAKETALILPAILLTYEYCYGPRQDAKGLRRAVVRAVPFAAIAGAYLLLRFAVLGIQAPINATVSSAGMPAILITLVKAVGIYLWTLLFPYPLSAYYFVPLTTPVSDLRVLLPLVGLGASAILLWRNRRNAPLVFFALFSLETIMPVSNLIPIGAAKDMGFLVAERFLYLPSVSFCVLIAYFLDKGVRLAEAGPTHPLAPLRRYAVVALLLLYMLLTVSRNRDWQDEITFYQHTLQNTSSCAALIRFNLGEAYRREGRLTDAEGEVRAAIACDDELSQFHNNLANLLFLKGDTGEALKEWQRATGLDRGNYQAWFNLASVLEQERRLREAYRAYEYFLKTVPAWRRDVVSEVEARMNSLAATMSGDVP